VYRGARDIYARQLLEGARNDARFQDLAIEFVLEGWRKTSEDVYVRQPDKDKLLMACGGRWDRKHKQWSTEPPDKVLRVGVHPGQKDAALWWREWLVARITGEQLETPIYSSLLYGGSRSGKTHLGLRMAVAFMIAVPGSRVWLVQEAEIERADEIEAELDEFLPDEWFEKRGAQYRCVNGSVGRVRSAKYPAKLKRGRCDLAFLNEGQNVSELAHAMLRMRTSDTGGVVLIAANPPNDNPDGQWIADSIEEEKAGRRPNMKVFNLNAVGNPYINREQLEALKNETDPRTYEIEVLGRVLPPSDAVLHAFSPLENVAPVPHSKWDITDEFAAKCGLGVNVTDIVGLDFQRTPFMAAVASRAFRNPQDAKRPLLYHRLAIRVELGDEYDLSDSLYDHDFDPETTVLICDASGDWQDADRTKGGASFEILRRCGWRRIHKPDVNSERNPPLLERMKNDNRLFCSESGMRLVRIDPVGAASLIQVCKHYRMKHGKPSRNSQYTHEYDAMSYIHYRVYPRRVTHRGLGYKRLKGRKRASELKKL